MKKVALVLVVFILLASTAIPVMARSDGNNGHGNGQGNNPGTSTTTGNGNAYGHNKDKDKNGSTNGNFNRGNSTAPGRNKIQQTSKWMFKPFYLQGTITAIDSVAHSITVNVVHANAKAKSYIGSDLTVVFTDTTQIFQIDQTGDITGTDEVAPSASEDNDNESEDEGEGNRVPITFSQLAVGDRVAIHGTLADNVYTARLVTVYLGHPFNQNETQPVTPPLTQPITDNP